ncbi:EthD domain-containing protein [Roseofilum casamattae]|uniref:EthD domain-containing protein n=1 Tax=Roseofilum casamattae BLCC-M143 TaxID=3022442 RepID=A0ABT7C0N3_9CYAN|nr:EthD domain-containing protein [Roseofilum casamattae]MDJ1185008.1 EthD domain-containing protein [Roseofilum casamattae BLCC-M143]
MPNYAERDKEATAGIYVPMWKIDHIDLDTFDSYWGNGHGPVCARLPLLYQCWHIRVHHNHGDIWPAIDGVITTSTPEENFDSIAELTFKSIEDLAPYGKVGAEYLGDDEPNFVRRTIPHPAVPITYYDEIENPAPTWETEYDKFRIILRKQDKVNLTDFHQWLQVTFAPQLAKSAPVVKVRLSLLQPSPVTVDVVPPIQAAMEVAFKNRTALRTYLASDEYKSVTAGISQYVKSFQVYPERARSTILYNGEVTLAGVRGLSSALAIEKVGAINQTRDNITELMLKRV